MKIEAKTTEEFFRNSGNDAKEIRSLDSFIQEHLPTLDRKLYHSKSICTLGYGEIPYKTTSQETSLPIIAIAPQKNYVSLYVMAWKDGNSIADIYSGRLGKTSNGKGCIRFKKFADLDLNGLKNMLMDVYECYKIQLPARDLGR